MELDQITCSIVTSGGAILLYMGVAWYYGQKPDLAHALIVAMSCSGVVAAVALASLTYSAKEIELGVLATQKSSILIGTLAMAWVSVASAYSSITHPRRAAKDSA